MIPSQLLPENRVIAPSRCPRKLREGTTTRTGRASSRGSRTASAARAASRSSNTASVALAPRTSRMREVGSGGAGFMTATGVASSKRESWRGIP